MAAPRLIEVEIEDLPKMGWIQITSVGQENLYFIKDDQEYFVKLF